MPTFPKYRGELPQCLNPLNIRHYFLLAYWAYFRPTALHCYLYEASPEIYRAKKVRFRQIWNIAAYRNLYLMGIPAILLFVLMIGLVIGIFHLSALLSHTGAIWDMAITPDGEKVVSASGDTTLRVWNLETGETLHILRGHTDRVLGIAVTSNGKKVISASDDKTLKVWNLETGKLLHTLQGHTDRVWGIAVTSNGKKAISASDDKTLKVWNLETGKLLYTLQGHTDKLRSMVVTSNGEKAISASDDKTLKVWNLETGKLLHTLQGHTDKIWGPERQQIWSLDKNTVKLWNLETGKLIWSWQNPDWIKYATWNEKKGISTLEDGTLQVWDRIQKGNPLLYTWKGHYKSISRVIIISNERVISASLDGTLRLWDLKQGKAIPIKKAKFRLVLFGLGILIILCSLIGASILSCLCDFWMEFKIKTIEKWPFLQNNLISIAILICFATTIAILIMLSTCGISFTFQSIVVEANILGFPFVSPFPLSRFGPWIFLILTVVPFAFYMIFSFTQSLCLFSYPVELCLALGSDFRGLKQLVLWNERRILPLPNTQRLLGQCLKQDEAAGLGLIIEVARNPFCFAAQKALQSYLHTHPAPLHLLYKLVNDPEMNTYAAIPKSEHDWEHLPTIGHRLIGQLCGEYVQSDSYDAWILTGFCRDKRKTPLTKFAHFLNSLLENGKIYNFWQFSRKVKELQDDCHTDLISYPGGEEIANSFRAMATFIHYYTLSPLPKAVDIVKQHGYATLLTLENAAIRPTVINALIHLGEVGAEITTYQDATSKVNKQAALLRATDTLEKLEQYITDEVFPPEQAILQQIIEKWRKLVSEEGGEIGRAIDIKPVANPYIVGNPVTGSLFVGREDIMRRLEELWMPEQRPSVVIYGHRRMGKTSILKNLGARFGSNTVIIDFNMQRIGGVNSTGQLLYYLTIKLYDSLSSNQQVRLKEPDRENFAQDPYFALDRFLQQLNVMQLGKRFIIAVDEFEKIEEWIKEKRIEPELLDFWRGLIQTYPWFVMAFAGLHTLREMTENYWNPLFGSVTAISVSFLSPKGAEQLIVQPTPDFELDYDSDAIEQIINLTNGQPYLVQLMAHTLVTRFNYQTFEEGIERERRFTLEDVEAIINTKEFYLAGNAYFQGVWEQAEKSKSTGQGIILTVLSQTDLSLAEISDQTALSLAQVQSALDTLQRHDVVMQRDGRFFYTVELMRRWVAEKR
jgi:WD40 repeat protein